MVSAKNRMVSIFFPFFSSQEQLLVSIYPYSCGKLNGGYLLWIDLETFVREVHTELLNSAKFFKNLAKTVHI